MGLIQEFKEFAMKGNVVDMAIGIIMGAEFGKIVNSIVGDVLMPPLGKLIGGVNFSELKYSLGQTIVKSKDGAPDVVKEAFINFGICLQTIFNFLIIAFAVFMLVKAKGIAEQKMIAARPPAPPAATPEDVTLLREIRDALTAKK